MSQRSPFKFRGDDLQTRFSFFTRISTEIMISLIIPVNGSERVYLVGNSSTLLQNVTCHTTSLPYIEKKSTLGMGGGGGGRFKPLSSQSNVFAFALLRIKIFGAARETSRRRGISECNCGRVKCIMYVVATGEPLPNSNMARQKRIFGHGWLSMLEYGKSLIIVG